MKKNVQLNAGGAIAGFERTSMRGTPVAVPDPERVVHLQFRRFAGCPVCDLHLRSFMAGRGELEAAGIREVVVFHSSAEDLLRYESELPFEVVPDPDKRLYAAFGVEAAPRALLDPRVWVPILRGVLRSAARVVRRRQALPPINPHGGSIGLPADFLIASDGRVLACKYGRHAYDQWSVEEVRALAATRDSGRGSR